MSDLVGDFRRHIFSWRGSYEYRRSRSFIDWPWSIVTQIQHFQTSFPEKPLGGLKSNLIVEPQLVGGTQICSNGPGHMTKMAAMPIYGKT